MMTMYHKVLILIALSLVALCYGEMSLAQTVTTIPIDNIGEFKVTTYPGDATRSNQIDIEFHPNAAQVNCTKIVFDQSVKMTFLDGASVVATPSDVTNRWVYRDDDTEADGRYIDHLFCSREPHYPHGTHGNTAKPATMSDVPMVVNGDFLAGKTKVVFEFEVCARCIEGTDTGTTYGCFKWTYTRTRSGGNGTSAPVSGSGSTAPSDSHKKAQKKFEDNHKNPNPPPPTICPEELAAKACPNKVNGKKGPLLFHVNSDYDVTNAGPGVRKGRTSPDRGLINNPIGASVTACDYILVPKGQTITLKKTDCKSGAFGRAPATESIPFEATFVDLLTGEIETVESGLCYYDDHCGTIAMTCGGVPLAAAAPVDTDDSTTLIFYTARVDDSTDAVTFTNDPLSSHAIQAYDIAGGTGMLVEIYPGESHTFIYPDMIPECFPAPTIAIEKTHDTYQGHFEYVSITLENNPVEMGGFDFLIAYDASALTFMEATPGQLLEDCDWEYFTYRYGVQGNCGDACPSGLLRIIAIAERSDGPNHPSCYGPPDTDPHGLAGMRFLVTNDRTFEGQYVPIYFFWDDCGDNSISSVDGELLYIDRAVHDFGGNLIWNEEDDDQFPEDARIPFVGAPDYCFNPDPDKLSAIRLIDFVNGGIDIIPADSIDRKGDINLNGVPNEIADATVFTNYFIYGLDAFTINVEGQTAATDVNADGTPLTVGDLVYLIRVIVGDALPIPKLTPNSRNASTNMLVNHSALSISANSPVDLGAGYFAFKYSGYTIGEPHLINGASNMTLKYSDENGILKILVYSMEEGRRIAAGTESIFIIPIEGDGMIELTEVQLSDYNGNMMVSRIEDKPILPRDFALHQNYPNPFNMTTQIIYELPGIARVRINVINMMGQKVTTLINSEQSAGVHRIEWNGTDQSGNEVASGIYFYRLESDGYVETKKMTLLK